MNIVYHSSENIFPSPYFSALTDPPVDKVSCLVLGKYILLLKWRDSLHAYMIETPLS